MIEPTPQDLLADGWTLIPVGSDKKPLIKWKQFQVRPPTSDERAEWEAMRPAVWGGVTGSASGRVALDFDGEPGRQTLEELGLDPHRSTPNQGFHLDVVAPPWKVTTVSGKTKKALGAAYPGLDIRGPGGYINVLGGTNTGSYTWLRPDRLPYPYEILPEKLRTAIGLVEPVGAIAVPPCPALIIPEVHPALVIPGSSAVTMDRMVILIQQAIDEVLGGAARNDTGFWLACQLRDNSVDRASAEVAMRAFVRKVPPFNAKGMSEPYTEGEALSSLDQAWTRPPRQAWLLDRPVIYVSNRQLDSLSDEARTVLLDENDPPQLFSRGGDVVRTREDGQGLLRIERLDVHDLRHRLARTASWVKGSISDDDDDQRGPTNVYPPTDVVRDLLSGGWSEFPTLLGVATAPCLRLDGTVLEDDGYDPASKLWLKSDLTVPPIPLDPSAAEIKTATSLLLDELLGEFPFADEPSRANALGFLLSLVLRSAIPGLVPLCLMDAPVAGSGKTLLVNIASLIARGQPAGLTAAPSANEEELRKRLTSLLLAPEPLIVFDNVEGNLKSGVLAQALTSVTWTDRILGVSRTANLPQNAVWAATGNNVAVVGDLIRRTFVVRLDPKLAQPWTREFRRPNLEDWVLAERSDLLHACLLLGRAWFAQGKPPMKAKPWGTFNRWTNMIGGILAVAGIDGFLGNLAELHAQADAETSGWERLLGYWWHSWGSDTRRTTDLLHSITVFSDEPPPSLVESIGQARTERAEVSRLARKLRSIEGRRFGADGLRIVAIFDPHLKSTNWMVMMDATKVNIADPTE